MKKLFIVVSLILLTACTSTVTSNDVKNTTKLCETHGGLYEIIKFIDNTIYARCVDHSAIEVKDEK